MTDYNTLSDFEINKRVAHFTGWDPNYWHNLPDYCNNPSDAWPVIVDNKIDTGFSDFDLNFARGGNVDLDGVFEFSSIHANPLRAAMICFLMMEESEDE